MPAEWKTNTGKNDLYRENLSMEVTWWLHQLALIKSSIQMGPSHNEIIIIVVLQCNKDEVKIKNCTK